MIVQIKSRVELLMEGFLAVLREGSGKAIVHPHRWYPAHKAQVLFFFSFTEQTEPSYSDRDTTEEELSTPG